MDTKPSVASDAPDTPPWAAGGFVSDMVNVLIGIKPVFSVLQNLARKTLIDTAEKSGVQWRDTARMLKDEKQEELDAYYREVNNAAVTYPDYYTQEFHAYEEGNLNWLAAYECESATMGMALRTYKKESLTPSQAQDRLRYSIFESVDTYCNEHGLSTDVKDILDVGCSVGVSTFYLADRFRASNIVGLDLSPHFLAVAKYRQKERQLPNIRWMHAQAEQMPLESNSFDYVNMGFVIHECRPEPTKAIFTDMYRVTKPGGVYCNMTYYNVVELMYIRVLSEKQ
jgi:SAM-dependent methyltransferase